MSVRPDTGSAGLKLAVSTFVMRGADRDKKADRARIDRLVETIDITIQDIQSERDGLVQRVKKTIDQKEAVSKKKLARRDSPQVSPLVELKRAEKRLNRLSEQKRELEAARVRFLQWANSGD